MLLNALVAGLPPALLRAQEGYRYLDLGVHCDAPRPRLPKSGDRDSLLEVDEVPVIRPGFGPPVPPRSLEGSTPQATTLVFVVDSSGKIELCSVMVVEESSALWSWAVSRVLPKYRYRPGTRRGEAVAVWVQQTIRYPATGYRESDRLHLRRP